MKMLVKVFLLSATYAFAYSLPEQSFFRSCENDDWEPLFFTPYIKANKTREARERALVNFTDCLHSGPDKVWNITSYSGFFTVDPEDLAANYYVWYFPPTNKTNDVDAVIVWLQGGPGSSSLYGLFAENGPILYKDGHLGVRDVHWAQNYHMIYVDNPVGTGFSFTDKPEAYCRNQTQVARNLLLTLIQFYQVFPELQDHMLIIAGESYAGKYVPALGEAIFTWNSAKDFKLNLSALVIGNGFTDPENQLVYDKYLYQLGLIDSYEAEGFQDQQEKTIQHIRAGEWEKALDDLQWLILSELSLFSWTTGITYPYNFLYTHEYQESGINEFLSHDCFRQRIHVGNYTFVEDSNDVWKYLEEDIPKSMAPTVSFLLDHYNVVFYNGQLDLLVPFVSTDNLLRKLNFTGSENFDTADKEKWTVDGELAGYVKTVGNLVQVLVRNAGHMVPMDQPKWSLDLIDKTVRLCARSGSKKSFTNGGVKTINFLDDE